MARVVVGTDPNGNPVYSDEANGQPQQTPNISTSANYSPYQQPGNQQVNFGGFSGMPMTPGGGGGGSFGFGDIPIVGDAYSKATGAAGFRNPNSSPEGAALQAQLGDTVTWGDTAKLAQGSLGYDMPTAQLGPIDWLKANVTNANAQQASAAPAAAQQAAASNMTGAQLNLDQANQTRAAQQALTGSLQGTAAGQGPSVAQEQLRQATAANVNQQLSAAQSAHGAARLAALRNAQTTNAATQQLANSQASALRAQEIANAQSNLGNVLGQGRAADVNTALANANLAQQTGLTNAGFGQQANLLNAQLGTNTSQFNAGLAGDTSRFNAQLGANTSQFNAGAANAAEANYASQANAGNQAAALANLQAWQNAQTLNTQRAQSNIAAQQGAAAGQTGIGTTRYTGTAGYDQSKRQMTGNILGNIGQGKTGLAILGK
jgi:hypothetical protein